jgi:hypothetical protein
MSVIHRKKLFDGRETAQQVHAELAWYGLSCGSCGGPPALQVQVFALLSDLSPNARLVMGIEIENKRVDPIKTPKGTAVRMSHAVACSMCAPALERAAARGPSWAWVELDRGPGADNPIVGVIDTLA